MRHLIATLLAVILIALMTNTTTAFVDLDAMSSAEAAVCNVPASYATIQAAIDDTNCSEIAVAAGYYVGPDLDLTVDRTLTIRGVGQTGTLTEATFINYRILVINDAVVTLENFAIDGLGPINGVELSSFAAGVIGNNITINRSLGWGITHTSGVNTGNTFATLSNCSIYGNAGGVAARTLTMTNCDVYGNNRFGGVNVGKTGTISHSKIYNNAQDFIQADGAGVLFDSFENRTLLIEHSEIYDNDTHIDPAQATLDGGGVMVRRGHVTIRNSEIYDNVASGRGGGIAVHNIFNARLTLEDSTVRNNTSYYGGGGVSAGDRTIIRNSLITENVTRYDANFNMNGLASGGGVYGFDDAQVTISDTTVSHNGTDSATSTLSGNSGGGIYLGPTYEGTTFRVERSIIHDNYAQRDGGGVANHGDLMAPDENLTLINTTVVGNWAFGNGGGVYNTPLGTTYIDNSTIVGNSADHDQDGIGDGGGISGLAFVNHALINQNSSTNPAGTDCDGGVSHGYSLIGIVDGCPAFKQTGTDLVGDLNKPLDAALILPQADHGGPTHTIALKSVSPAVDAGSVDCNGVTHDQRVASRTAQDGNEDGGGDGDHCDIGAFEISNVLPPPPTAITLQERSVIAPHWFAIAAVTLLLVGTTVGVVSRHE